MNEMNTSNRDYDNRDYDNRDYRDYRDYDNRDYRNYRDYDDRYYDSRSYREDYRKRDYDRRGGKINNRDYRNYRNYREQDYYEELEMAAEDMREQYRKLEDVSEMAHNMQDKNMIMKIAEKEKENYNYLKQLVNKQM
jgi:hypothetical protein